VGERPIRVEELDHVVLRCRDPERALDFYTRILGLVEERRIEAIGLIQLRAGRGMIDLVPSPERSGEPAVRYGARGIGPSVYVRDPEGNVVELKPGTGAAS